MSPSWSLIAPLIGAAVGIALIADRAGDPGRLGVFCGVALIVLGVDRFVRRTGTNRTTSLVLAGTWTIVGVAAPFVTFRSLAVLVGAGLTFGGVLEIVATARRPHRSPALFLDGVVGVFAGLTALSWPTVTVLVLSTCLGLRMLWFASERILERRGRERDMALPPRVAPRATALVVVLAALSISVAVNRSQPDEPGPFYSAPSELPALPGTLIRSEVIAPFVPGATAHRILYVSTDHRGRLVPASGLVAIPDGPRPEGGWPVVAFTHGTIGIARNCAPSLIAGDVYGPAIPGIDAFLAAGFAVAATDYAGLGTAAVTGYLIGRDQAYSALDSVRAADQIPGVDTDDRFVVFGESQGGHAALFTGELAANYAPDLELVGVAAAAPATDLSELFEANVGTPFGDILASFALVSWERSYEDRDLDLADVVDADALATVHRLSELCIQDQRQIAALFPEAAILQRRFLSAPPWATEPWASIIEENTPGQWATPAPILLLQGADDPLVLPSIQRRFVSERLCAVSADVEFRLVPDVGHLDAGHATGGDVAEWALDRFAGRPTESTCMAPGG